MACTRCCTGLIFINSLWPASVHQLAVASVILDLIINTHPPPPYLPACGSNIFLPSANHTQVVRLVLECPQVLFLNGERLAIKFRDLADMLAISQVSVV
jgi:hypothetical protein